MKAFLKTFLPAARLVVVLIALSGGVNTAQAVPKPLTDGEMHATTGGCPECWDNGIPCKNVNCTPPGGECSYCAGTNYNEVCKPAWFWGTCAIVVAGGRCGMLMVGGCSGFGKCMVGVRPTDTMCPGAVHAPGSWACWL